MRLTPDWQKVNPTTWRLAVPGGWLIWSNYVNEDSQMIFVADGNYEWE